MPGHMSNSNELPQKPARRGLGPGANLLAAGFVFLAVLVPFLFWQQTWFGTALSDQEIQKNLDPSAKPRKIQHALAQLSEKAAASGSASVAQWRPAVRQLADHPIAEVRMTVAWFMGQDSTAEGFQECLTRLLQDVNLLVRRNAALSLIAFGDAGGLEEVRGMLTSHRIVASASGKVFYRLKKTDSVRPGTLVARIQVGEEAFEAIRSVAPGYVEEQLAGEGAMVSAGQPLVSIAPEEEQVWESLRALYFIGEMKDLPVIEPFLAENPMLSGRVQQQARFSIRAINSRAKPQKHPSGRL